MSKTKKRVTGIGGIFFKTKNPNETNAWYQKHLGLNTDKYGTCFEWRQADDNRKKGFSQWMKSLSRAFRERPSSLLQFVEENCEFVVNSKNHIL